MSHQETFTLSAFTSREECHTAHNTDNLHKNQLPQKPLRTPVHIRGMGDKAMNGMGYLQVRFVEVVLMWQLETNEEQNSLVSQAIRCLHKPILSDSDKLLDLALDIWGNIGNPTLHRMKHQGRCQEIVVLNLRNKQACRATALWHSTAK